MQSGVRSSRELLVPAIMLSFVVAYWSDAWHLSSRAQAFPGALTLILFVALFFVAISSHQSSNSASEDGQDRHFWRRSAIVIAPTLLIAVWDFLGATIALAIYAIGILFILRERRIFWMIVYPVGISMGLVFVFRTFLYLRLPSGAIPF